MFGLGGQTDRSGGLGQQISDRVSGWRAHPFQNGLATLAGGVNPLLGQGLGAMFGRVNDRNFNQSAQTGYDNSLQQTTMDANSAMNKPLNGPLGQFDGMGGSVSGGSSSQGFGGSGNGNPQAWNYQNFADQLSGKPQAQSPFVESILNSIGPNGPGMSGNGGGGGNEGMGTGGGMGQGMSSFGGPLAGGGLSSVMNGASPGMLADFAAPQGGDWMARLQSHIGANGPYAQAKQA